MGNIVGDSIKEDILILVTSLDNFRRIFHVFDRKTYLFHVIYRMHSVKEVAGCLPHKTAFGDTIKSYFLDN